MSLLNNLRIFLVVMSDFRKFKIIAFGYLLMTQHLNKVL